MYVDIDMDYYLICIVARGGFGFSVYVHILIEIYWPQVLLVCMFYVYAVSMKARLLDLHIHCTYWYIRIVCTYIVQHCMIIVSLLLCRLRNDLHM